MPSWPASSMTSRNRAAASPSTLRPDRAATSPRRPERVGLEATQLPRPREVERLLPRAARLLLPAESELSFAKEDERAAPASLSPCQGLPEEREGFLGPARERQRRAQEAGRSGEEEGDPPRVDHLQGSLEHGDGVAGVPAAEVHVAEAPPGRQEGNRVVDRLREGQRRFPRGQGLGELAQLSERDGQIRPAVDASQHPGSIRNVRWQLTGAEQCSAALPGGPGALLEVPDGPSVVTPHGVGLSDVEAGADPEPGLPPDRGDGQRAPAGLDGLREVPLQVQGHRQAGQRPGQARLVVERGRQRLGPATAPRGCAPFR